MFKVIRNNPKKSIFGSFVLAYGLYYGKNKYSENLERRFLCSIAKVYGDELIKSNNELTKITVILNPVANNGKSAKNFYKDVYPLLNLNGYSVTVVESSRKEEAKKLMSVMKVSDQNCLVVAGGDGTLLEVITGIMRREDLRNELHKIPILLTPLGSKNDCAKSLNLIDENNILKTLDNSVKLIRDGKATAQSCIQITSMETKSSDDSSTKPKDIFAMSSFKWSLDKDIEKMGKRKWFLGNMRYHFQYVISGLLDRHLNLNKSATIQYELNCDGCSNCLQFIKTYEEEKSEKINSPSKLSRIVSYLFPLQYNKSINSNDIKNKTDKNHYEQLMEKSKNTNEQCGILLTKDVDNVRGIHINLKNNKLRVTIQPKESRLYSYISSGFNYLKSKSFQSISENSEIIDCSSVKILPYNLKEKEKFYVDNDELDVVPVELQVIKNAPHILQ